MFICTDTKLLRELTDGENIKSLKDCIIIKALSSLPAFIPQSPSLQKIAVLVALFLTFLKFDTNMVMLKTLRAIKWGRFWNIRNSVVTLL